MPTYGGDRLLLIPPISRMLTSTETGGRRSQIFCRDEKIYRQSEGDPVGLTSEVLENSCQCVPQRFIMISESRRILQIAQS
jgi:hypothetical protein